MKAYNFNAGPCVLPKQAIESAIEAIRDFDNTGIGILEISHRTPGWERIMAETEQLWRELLNIPEDYAVMFLGGGASTQFFEVPANLLKTKAAYLQTGVWAKKAVKEAKFYGEVQVVASSEEAGVYAIMNREGRQIFITGHSEYDADTLNKEYVRDKTLGLPIRVPVNYFPDDDDTQDPIVRWRGHANLLFSNWLNYFVYQTTPYDIMNIGQE